jgi:hypothetical protein
MTSANHDLLDIKIVFCNDSEDDLDVEIKVLFYNNDNKSQKKALKLFQMIE